MSFNNSANYLPTQYDVLVGGANGAISSVGPGSSGQIFQSAGNASNPAYSTATYPTTASTVGNVLTSDGTNWNSSAPVASTSMIYLTTITASNSASIAFTSTYITSTYSTYKIILNNIVPVTNATDLQCLMSVDNGSDYLATNYKSGINRNAYNTATLTNGNSTTFIYLAASVDNTASLGVCGDVNFYGLPATIIKFVAGKTVGVISASTTNYEVFADQTGTTAVNNLEFLFSSGNISSGSISLYGIY